MNWTLGRQCGVYLVRNQTIRHASKLDMASSVNNRLRDLTFQLTTEDDEKVPMSQVVGALEDVRAMSSRQLGLQLLDSMSKRVSIVRPDLLQSYDRILTLPSRKTQNISIKDTFRDSFDHLLSSCDPSKIIDMSWDTVQPLLSICCRICTTSEEIQQIQAGFEGWLSKNTIVEGDVTLKLIYRRLFRAACRVNDYNYALQLFDKLQLRDDPHLQPAMYGQLMLAASAVDPMETDCDETIKEYSDFALRRVRNKLTAARRPGVGADVLFTSRGQKSVDQIKVNHRLQLIQDLLAQYQQQLSPDDKPNLEVFNFALRAYGKATEYGLKERTPTMSTSSSCQLVWYAIEEAGLKPSTCTFEYMLQAAESDMIEFVLFRLVEQKHPFSSRVSNAIFDAIDRAAKRSKNGISNKIIRQYNQCQQAQDLFNKADHYMMMHQAKAAISCGLPHDALRLLRILQKNKYDVARPLLHDLFDSVSRVLHVMDWENEEAESDLNALLIDLMLHLNEWGTKVKEPITARAIYACNQAAEWIQNGADEQMDVEPILEKIFSISLALATANLHSKDIPGLKSTSLPAPNAELLQAIESFNISYVYRHKMSGKLWNALRIAAERTGNPQYVEDVLSLKQKDGVALQTRDYTQLIEVYARQFDSVGIDKSIMDLHNHGLKVHPQHLHAMVKNMLRLEDMARRARRNPDYSLHDIITYAQDQSNMHSIQLYDATWIAILKRCQKRFEDHELQRALQMLSTESRSKKFHLWLQQHTPFETPNPNQ